GELILENVKLEFEGNLFTEEETLFTRIQINKQGYGKLKNNEGNILYLIVLSRKKALNLNANFNEKNLFIAWGVYSILFNNQNNLKIETFDQETLFLLDPNNQYSNFEDIENCPIPGLKKKLIDTKIKVPEIKFTLWEELITRWDNELSSKVWKEINFEKEHDPLDHGFSCGHVLYKCEFIIPDENKLKLRLNIRNKAAVWLNGVFIEGDEMYSIKYLHPGAKNGPDPTFLGSKKYDLSLALVPGKNILYIITENLDLIQKVL
ncbi:MAG: hypothetical protein P8Y97_15605, partial [Candidatus Lokiarchaeota archaeon]